MARDENAFSAGGPLWSDARRVEAKRDEGARANSREGATRIGRNSSLVRPSIREARFTAGPRLKSSRSAAPTLPMNSPRCKPIQNLISARLEYSLIIIVHYIVLTGCECGYRPA